MEGNGMEEALSVSSCGGAGAAPQESSDRCLRLLNLEPGCNTPGFLDTPWGWEVRMYKSISHCNCASVLPQGDD